MVHVRLFPNPCSFLHIFLFEISFHKNMDFSWFEMLLELAPSKDVLSKAMLSTKRLQDSRGIEVDIVKW